MPRITRKKTEEKSIQQLVDEAAKLNEQAKEIEKLLKPIKTDLKKHIETNYSQGQIKEGFLIDGIDYILKVEGCEEREEADPEKVLDELTRQDKGDKFFDVIKINVTALVKIIGEETAKTLRAFKCYSFRQKFIKK